MKRASWFDKGADAVARIWPSLPRCYVCPLCGDAYLPDAVGQLTKEHAPPEALGGRAVALTCRTCNSTSGHLLDAEMVAAEQVLDFAMGTMSKPARVKLQIAGYQQNSTALSTGENVQVFGLTQCNPPGTGAAISAELGRLTAQGQAAGLEFHLTFDQKFNLRLALLGWLRDAFLVAFAWLGYRYALSSNVKPVRGQLADTSASLIDMFSATMPNALPDERRIIVVNKPERLHSLMVQMGRHCVFLPHPDGDIDLYERLANAQDRGDRLEASVNGLIAPWPTRPMHVLDLLDRRTKSGA